MYVGISNLRNSESCVASKSVFSFANTITNDQRRRDGSSQPLPYNHIKEHHGDLPIDETETAEGLQSDTSHTVGWCLGFVRCEFLWNSVWELGRWVGRSVYRLFSVLVLQITKATCVLYIHTQMDQIPRRNLITTMTQMCAAFQDWQWKSGRLVDTGRGRSQLLLWMWQMDGLRWIIGRSKWIMLLIFLAAPFASWRLNCSLCKCLTTHPSDKRCSVDTQIKKLPWVKLVSLVRPGQMQQERGSAQLPLKWVLVLLYKRYSWSEHCSNCNTS